MRTHPNSNRRNYLTRLARERSQPNWLKRECRSWVRLAYPSHGLRKIVCLEARVVEISEGGAKIYGRIPPSMSHLYVVLGNFELAIGAVVSRRSETHFEVVFNKEQSPALINRLSRVGIPYATISDLQFVLGSRLEARTAA